MGNTVLDLKGLRYTMPVVKTAAAIKKAEEGAVFEVVSDYPPFVDDIRRWCEETGNPLVDLLTDGGEIKATIKKGA